MIIISSIIRRVGHVGSTNFEDAEAEMLGCPFSGDGCKFFILNYSSIYPIAYVMRGLGGKSIAREIDSPKLLCYYRGLCAVHVEQLLFIGRVDVGVSRERFFVAYIPVHTHIGLDEEGDLTFFCADGKYVRAWVCFVPIYFGCNCFWASRRSNQGRSHGRKSVREFCLVVLHCHLRCLPFCREKGYIQRSLSVVDCCNRNCLVPNYSLSTSPRFELKHECLVEDSSCRGCATEPTGRSSLLCGPKE